MLFNSTFRRALQFVTSCSYHSYCVSLWGVRLYLMTYVNIKVLYLLKQNAVIYTCYFAAFVHCVAFRVELGIMK